MMTMRYSRRTSLALFTAALLAAVAAPAPGLAQAGAEHDVTFGTDIAPILQRSCQKRHRPNAIAPMSLIDYDEVRPGASAAPAEAADDAAGDQQ